MSESGNGNLSTERDKSSEIKSLSENPPIRDNAKSSNIKGPEYWKKRGFSKLPKSNKEGKAALDASNYLCTLESLLEYREMLAAGQSANVVCKYVFERESKRPTHTFGTVSKYLQLYRSFFIKPMELLESGEFTLQGGRRANVRKGPNGGYSKTLKEKLGYLTEGLMEIAIGEKTLEIQYARILDQRKLEESLNFPLPNLHKEVAELTKTLESLVNLKADLGYQVIRRV